MKLTSLLEGLILGAGAMYLLDPDRGTRRQALIRDRIARQLNGKGKALEVMQRDFKNRARGLAHELQGRMEASQSDDQVIVQRVRSAIGRCCTHTEAIEVNCENGEVTLAGPMSANQVADLVGTVKNVKGVTRVINDLELVHGDAQPSSPRTEHSRWTPAECLVAVTAGTILSIYGVGRRGLSGWILGFGGATMIAKGFRDTEHRFEQRGQGNTGKASPSISSERASTERKGLNQSNPSGTM